VIDHGFKPRLDQTKKHSVIDHGFEPRLGQTKKHIVIDHGFRTHDLSHYVFWFDLTGI
jgi:hypothetical protein